MYLVLIQVQYGQLLYIIIKVVYIMFSVFTCFDSIFPINFQCFLSISYIISGVKRLSNVFVKYLDVRTRPVSLINNNWFIKYYTWHISNRLLTVDGSVYIKIMWEACELLSCNIPAVQLHMCLQYKMKQKIETMLYIIYIINTNNT